ncbi:MAG: PadR family transcriptional regulator [Methermicoccaceae archaeon]
MEKEHLIAMRKGLLKFVVMRIIDEKPTHGYEIIKQINTLTDGRWMPSPGSIYPILSLLESKGYLSSHMDGKRKVYSLTKKGKALVSKIDTHIRQMHEEVMMLFGDLLTDAPPKKRS